MTRRCSLIVLFSVLAASTLPVSAQNAKWNGKKAAVILTYDDCLDVHLDNVVPALDSAGLKGTFYLTVSSQAFIKRRDEWKLAAIKGHELGNHTMYHPCEGGSPGRSWVAPEYDLATYTIRRLEDEIKMTNVMLSAVDGKSERTFAYPCGDLKAGGQLYVGAISDDFVGARTTEEKVMQWGHIDPYTVGSFNIAGQDGDYMINIVKKAMAEGGMVVFLFHGVGGGHGLNVALPEHRKLIHFLQKNQENLWVPTFVEGIQFVKAKSK